MRFHYGTPLPSRTFDAAAAGWSPLTSRAASHHYTWIALTLGLPFLIAATVVLLKNAGQWRAFLDGHPWAWVVFVGSLLLLVPLHEFVHALAYRCGLRSPHLILGVWPQRGVVYVLYDSPLPRRRVLFMLASPFVALTAFFGAVVMLAPAEVKSMGVFFLLAHTSACSGDFITFYRIWTRVPSGALVHNQGSDTYWARPVSSC
jgi:FtsH-binding integral membrane protein